jgi:hypothetical protein
MIMNAQEFLQQRTSKNGENYLRASTEEAPLEVWTEIAENFPDMKIWVVRNKTVPVETLRRLAADSAHDVRVAVATKNKLPEDLMMQLAADVDESVRERIAFNKNAPKAVLEHLANDPIERIALKARTRLTTGAWHILKQP